MVMFNLASLHEKVYWIYYDPKEDSFNTKEYWDEEGNVSWRKGESRSPGASKYVFDKLEHAEKFLAGAKAMRDWTLNLIKGY